MQKHGPKCLEGPVVGSDLWWQNADRNGKTQRKRRKSPSNKRGNPRSGIRIDLVERIRREIAEGVYDTPEKWQAALDKLQFAIENR